MKKKKKNNSITYYNYNLPLHFSNISSNIFQTCPNQPKRIQTDLKISSSLEGNIPPLPLLNIDQSHG